MPLPLLTADSISFHYPKASIPAFDNVSFHLNKGEIMCLAGVNGSGKSTLLYTLSGLYLPTSGALQLHPFQHQCPADETAEKLRKHSALVVQQADLQILGSTVQEDMEMTCKTFDDGSGQLIGKAQHILSLLRLEHKLAVPAHMLSYGEKRKLCLATAFVRSPSLLLLDEPFSGLDYPACLELIAYIRYLSAQKTAIIISTHDTDLVYPLARRFLFLSPHLPPFFGGSKDALAQFEAYNLKPLVL